MQDKQKVTLYLPPELHRQLKIRAAVDSEPMSAIAEQALGFYLAHPEVIEEVEAAREVGVTHQIYTCPECTAPVTLNSGKMTSLKQSSTLHDELEDLSVQSIPEELVPARV